MYLERGHWAEVEAVRQLALDRADWHSASILSSTGGIPTRQGLSSKCYIPQDFCSQNSGYKLNSTNVIHQEILNVWVRDGPPAAAWAGSMAMESFQTQHSVWRGSLGGDSRAAPLHPIAAVTVCLEPVFQSWPSVLRLFPISWAPNLLY